MAQKGQSLLYVCRSCRQHLQKPSVPSRPFSTTLQRSKTIPSFEPTSSEELNDLLGMFRQKIFTPAVLAEHHRRLMYRPSRHQVLTNDPGVTVTLSDGEDIKLEPSKRWDRPKMTQSLHNLARYLGETNEPQAWANLIGFLEGMKQSNERVRDSFVERITRKANEQEQAGIIVRCAEMVNKTGLSLSIPGVTTELMLGCHQRAAADRFQGDKAQKELKRAERIRLLLEEKEHCGGLLKPGRVDMRKDVLVLGVLLELNAAQAVNNNSDTAIGQKSSESAAVTSYVKKILTLDDSQITARPEPSYRLQDLNDEGQRARAREGKYLERLLPLWNGLKMASSSSSASGGELKQQMARRLQLVDREVKSAAKSVRENAGGKPRRALLMYDQLQG